MHPDHIALLQFAGERKKQSLLAEIPDYRIKKHNGDINDSQFFVKLFAQPFILGDAFIPQDREDETANQRPPQQAGLGMEAEMNCNGEDEDNNSDQDQILNASDALHQEASTSRMSSNQKNKASKREFKDKNRQIKVEAIDRGEKAVKGLKDLSRKVRQILYRKSPLTYRQVAFCLINETSSFLDKLTPENKVKEEQNIKRRVYDALNVLIAASVLWKEGKRIRPYQKKLPKNSIIIEQKLKSIASTIEKTEQKFSEIQRLRHQINRMRQLSSQKQTKDQGINQQGMDAESRSNELLIEIDEIKQKSKIQGKLRRRQNKRDEMRRNKIKKESSPRVDCGVIDERSEEDEISDDQTAKKRDQKQMRNPTLNPKRQMIQRAQPFTTSQGQEIVDDNLAFTTQKQKNTEFLVAQTQKEHTARQIRMERLQEDMKSRVSISLSQSQDSTLSKSLCFNRRLLKNQEIPFPTGGFLIKGDFKVQRVGNEFKIFSHRVPRALSRFQLSKMIFNHVDKLKRQQG